MSNFVIVENNNLISKYNYFKDFRNHGMSQIVAERFFDTLICLELIDSWSRKDMSTMCIIGWTYELK